MKHHRRAKSYLFLHEVLFALLSAMSLIQLDDAAFIASHTLEGGFEDPSKKDFSSFNIADALYEIASTLRKNQEHSSLYERVAVLEANLALSREKASLMERRIQELEKIMPDLNTKLESSTRILEKAEALESDTKNMLKSFEEKLSALASELLRVKRFSVTSETSKAIDDVQHGNDKILTKDTSEVEVKELCMESLSSSLCLFTLSGHKVTNWTSANMLCQLHGRGLASQSDLNMLNSFKDFHKIYWVAKSDEITSLNEEVATNFSMKPIQSYNVSIDTLSRDVHIERIINDTIRKQEDSDDLSFELSQDRDNSSESINIKKLSPSEASRENIQKSVYISNIRSNLAENIGSISSLTGSPEEDKMGISKRSLKENPSSFGPQNFHFKEFLLLRPLEDANVKNIQHLEPEGGVPILETDIADVIPFLRDKSASLHSERLAIDSEELKCPSVHCSEDKKCQVLMHACSELKAFLCRRNG